MKQTALNFGKRSLSPAAAAESAAKKPRLSEPVASTSKVAAAPNPIPAIPFNLDKFKSELSTSSSPSERDLLALELDIGESWLKVLHNELKKDYFLKLKRTLWDEGLKGKEVKQNKIFPAAGDIYSWSRFTPLDKVKVVILGQDPYHNDGQAHGLSFSVQPGVKIPPSLRNMYTEIKANYPDFNVPKHGYLGSWAEQGVLCLNTCLTVRAHQANSHSGKGWETFTDAVIELVNKYGGSGLSEAEGGVVFLAWGKPAEKRMAKVNKTKHLVLTSAHPSPLSARRGFIGNEHFKKANEWLRKRHGADAEVDWTKLDLPAKTT